MRMNAELAIAGLGWFVLAFGHTAVGLRWVLPSLRNAHLPSTPFGPPSMTFAMLRFTWHVVTVMLVGFGILFATLALASGADPKTLLLRWFAGLLLAVAAMACWIARGSPRTLLRLPVVPVFLVLAVICWTAST
jgi:hypothetical protein